MKLESTTTSELAGFLPAAEDNRWEFKDAIFLTKQKRTDFDNELAKQVSAFANTGGGILLFGIDDKTRQFQPCEEYVGGQPMKDFISTKVYSCVEYPLQGFQVHRIPFTGDSAKAVFLIVIPDSPSAPHQAKTDKRYYWRSDGATVPAPHFHLELLRSRYTKSVLEIVNCKPLFDVHQFLQQEYPRWSTRLTIRMIVTIKNISLQAAQPCGLLIRSEDASSTWTCDNTPLSDVVCQPVTQILFPNELIEVGFDLNNNIQTACINDHAASVSTHFAAIKAQCNSAKLNLRPVSQNHVGSDFHYEPLQLNDNALQTPGVFANAMRKLGWNVPHGVL